MKKVSIFIICFFIFISSLINAETIKIASTDYEPLIKYNPDKSTGVFIEIIDAAFGNVGIDVIYVSYPWKRAQQMAEQNMVDGVIPLFRTKEREEIFLFSDPVMIANNKFFYIKGRNIPEDFEWKTLADFRKFIIGGVIGYWYLSSFKEAGLTVEMVTDDDQNIQKMFKGRIDTFVADEVFGWHLVDKYYPNEKMRFGVIEKPESENKRYILFGKKNPNAEKLIEKFNEGLRMLKKSGKYDEIIKKYK